MKNVLNVLLENFVAEQIVKGNTVPSNVVEALAAPLELLNVTELKKAIIEDNANTLDEFVEEFNKYIVSKNYSFKSIELCDIQCRLIDDVERCIFLTSQYERTSRDREELGLSVLGVIGQLRQIKRQYKESLKLRVEGEEVVISEYESKRELVVLKCFKKACTCHSILLKALQRLNELLISEKFHWEKLLREKKNTLTRYKESEDCRDYLHILSEYTKLLKHQEALVSDLYNASIFHDDTCY